MTLIPFSSEAGFSDINISYLSGVGAPGGDDSLQDAAKAGSQYLRTNGDTYKKHTDGAGSDKWEISKGQAETWLPADGYVDSISGYAGFISNLGNWRIKKYSGLLSSVTRSYADNVNNSGYISLVTAWPDRETLIYT